MYEFISHFKDKLAFINLAYLADNFSRLNLQHIILGVHYEYLYITRQNKCKQGNTEELGKSCDNRDMNHLGLISFTSLGKKKKIDTTINHFSCLKKIYWKILLGKIKKMINILTMNISVSQSYDTGKLT